MPVIQVTGGGRGKRVCIRSTLPESTKNNKSVYRDNQVKVRSLRCALISCDWCHHRQGNKYKHTQKVDPVERDTQRRHLKTKKSALEQLLPSEASTGANLVHRLVSDFWALEL